MKSIHVWPELPTVSEEHVQAVKGYIYAVHNKKKKVLKIGFEMKSILSFFTSKMIDTKEVV